ncbi:MAG: ABC transporter substrate-binding protein [Nannocystaceae bacterium]|nr:ABC transporter substrate-binding protein [Nannocystaceae bacterium]
MPPNIEKRPGNPARILGAWLLASLTISGCNLVLDFQQCESDAECAGYENGSVCGAEGLCVTSSNDDCTQMVCDTAINLGTVSAQNGPNANLGIGMVAGLRTAFHEANEGDRVHGRDVLLTVRDDGYEPESTVPAMEELTDGGNDRPVLAIVGNVGTPTATVAIPIAEANNVVFHGAFTGAGVLRQDPPSRLVFNYRASYEQETEALVRYINEETDLADRVPAQNIAVLAQGTVAAADDKDAFDGYGTAGFTGVSHALNGKVSESEITKASYERNTANIDVAYEHYVTWLAGDQPVESDGVIHAAIIMVPTADPAANLIVAMQDAIAAAKDGMSPASVSLSDEQIAQLAKVDLFMGSVSFVGSDKLRSNLMSQSVEYCNHVAVSQVVPLPTGTSSGALDYREALTAFNDAEGTSHEPSFVSFEGYLAGRLFVDGLRNAPTLDTNGLVEGLHSLDGIEYGIGATLSFGVDEHQASDRVFGTELDSACEFVSLDLEG